jgi:hypothetical protein
MKNTTSIKVTLSTPGNVTFITEWLSRNKGKTRTRLAREMCERLGLSDGKGALRISTPLKALRELEAGGYWKLPAVRLSGLHAACKHHAIFRFYQHNLLHYKHY